jgi:hypothetical protein
MRRKRALKVDASLLPKQRKPIPHAFVLDAISTLSPYTRPMDVWLSCNLCKRQNRVDPAGQAYEHCG